MQYWIGSGAALFYYADPLFEETDSGSPHFKKVGYRSAFYTNKSTAFLKEAFIMGIEKKVFLINLYSWAGNGSVDPPWKIGEQCR